MNITPLHHLLWYDGPRFNYGVAKKVVTVNVVGSSWLIHGVPLAWPVCSVLEEFKQNRGGDKVLDFGAGSWVRCIQRIRKSMPTREVHAVEFNEGFHDDSVALKTSFMPFVTFWTPKSFQRLPRRKKFDLILLVNVLNTMPEEWHRRKVFACLSKRLNPMGWMVVYQRVWTAGVNPAGALQYEENGWLISQQPRFDYYTYRAGTGATWFNDQAEECGLEPYPTKTEKNFTSNNTLFKVWEKPFAS